MKNWTVWYVFDHDEADFVVIEAETKMDAIITFDTQLCFGMIDEVYESTASEVRLFNYIAGGMA